MSYDDIHLSHRDALLKKYGAFLKGKAFLEFGVYHGTSMGMWYGLHEQNKLPINFFGFDSFQGLPPETKDDNSFWNTGDFSTKGTIPPSLQNKDDITLVTGFYDESLDHHAAALLEGTKVGLVHIDCDTYSSTMTVWEWLIEHELLADGAIIVYDDWGAYLEAKCGEYDVGEAKAHVEIENTYDIKFTDLGKYVVDPAFYEVKLYQYER